MPSLLSVFILHSVAYVYSECLFLEAIYSIINAEPLLSIRRLFFRETLCWKYTAFFLALKQHYFVIESPCRCCPQYAASSSCCSTPTTLVGLTARMHQGSLHTVILEERKGLTDSQAKYLSLLHLLAIILA